MKAYLRSSQRVVRRLRFHALFGIKIAKVFDCTLCADIKFVLKPFKYRVAPFDVVLAFILVYVAMKIDQGSDLFFFFLMSAWRGSSWLSSERSGNSMSKGLWLEPP